MRSGWIFPRIANIATALTVLIAVAFGLIEMRRARREREERAAFSAVKAILSSEWIKSMIVVHSIPDGSTASGSEAEPRVPEAVHSLGVILEGLGYSVFARIVPLHVVADLVGGTIRLAWRKLRPSVEAERARRLATIFRMVPDSVPPTSRAGPVGACS